MHFSQGPIKHGTNEVSSDTVKLENQQHEEAAANGYTTGVFNMLFLLQNKIVKNEKNEYFDENLFRSYFKKLYKSLFRMEGEFMSILDREARKGFMQFTRSLGDLATEFKC